MSVLRSLAPYVRPQRFQRHRACGRLVDTASHDRPRLPATRGDLVQVALVGLELPGQELPVGAFEKGG